MTVHQRFASVALFLVPAVFGQQLPFVHIPNSPPNAGTVFQDSLGRLWLGANNTVSCFDGARFFSLRDFGLPESDWVTDITEDNGGAIWIASDIGLHRFYRGHLEQVLKAFVVSVLNISPDTMLVSSGPFAAGIPEHASLVRIQRTQDTKWKAEKLTDLESHGELTLDRNGIVLYPYNGGVGEIRREDLVAWHSGTKLPIARLAAPEYYGGAKVLRDRFGCIWVRNEGNASYQCPDDPRFIQLPPEIASEGSGISEADDGTVVVASHRALAFGRPGKFHVATPVNGLPVLGEALMGKDGTLWLSAAQGLFRLSSPFRMEYWTERDGLVMPASIARIGSRTFAASGGGLAVLAPDRGRWLTLGNSRALGGVWDLLPTPKGTLLAALPGAGVAEVRQDGAIIAHTPPAAKQAGAKLARSDDGQVWVAGLGVGRVVRKGNELLIEPENLPEPRLNGLDLEFQSHTGKLWACYAGGLVVKESEAWRRITTREGLLQNGCRAIAVHPNGDVWFSYNTIPAFALVRISAHNHVTVRQFYGGGEVGTAKAAFFDVDSRGWLWRTGSDGVYVADARDAETGLWLHLSQAEGLPTDEGNQQSFYNDPDGSVWWAGGNAIIHLSPPPDFARPDRTPQIFVSALSWNGGGPKFVDAVGGIPHRPNLVAHIGSLEFEHRSALRIRYRVLPEQPAWRESRSLDLALDVGKWGRRTIEVQARIGSGPWSGTVTQALTILRPIWLSPPLLLGFAAIGFSTSIAGLRWLKRREDRARSLPDLAAWRLAALAPEVHDLIGTTLDSRYEVGEILARGGFGTVLTGRDRQNAGERCAIKVFRPEIMDKDLIARRFRQEVAALEQIRHPNVVRIQGHGTTRGGAPYLVMEFIEGETLRDALAAGGMPPQITASWLRQAGSALDQIHARGIYHRDLKPDNMMIRSTGAPEAQLVIIDFSIAIVKDPDKSIQGLSRAAGTFAYMAPEQAIGYADAATDIHSLAKVFIEILTGKSLTSLLPDAALDLSARMRELLPSLRPGLSACSIDLISAALEFDPSRRPREAGPFAETIARDLEDFTS